MQNWEIYTLEGLCTKIYSGGTPSTSRNEYYGGKIPWLNTKEVDFQYIRSTEKYITDEGLRQSSAKWVPENSIIIAMYGNTAGKSAITKIPLTTNQACCNLVVNGEKADFRFVYYRILNDYKFLKDLSVGGAQQNLNAATIKNYKIIAPPLQEQRAIASILSALDDKIELNLQMNKTLEEMAMALYKHWFVDFGPFQNGKFVESELGMIPEGWEVKSILDIADLLSGGTPKTTIKEYWDGNVNWVSAKDIGNGGVIYINETEKTITQDGVNNSSTKILAEDTVILVARGSVGKYGMIAKPMAMNQSCYGLFSKSDFSQGLVYLMFSMLIEQFKRMAYGSVFDTITTSTFVTTNVIFPPKEIINSLRDQIDPLFVQLKQNTLENQTLTTLRDTLLPKLISGQIRVKDAEQLVAASL